MTVPADIAVDAAARDGRARRDLRWYWATQGLSNIGDNVAAFVLPTIAIVTFHATSLGVGVLNMLAMGAYTLLGLVVGALLDRRRRRPVLIVADLVRCAAYASIPVAAALGHLRLPQLYVVVVVAGVMAVFFNVGSQAHLPTLVPPDMLASANARLEVVGTVAFVAGPMIGGALMEWGGAPTAIAVNAASFLVSIVGLRSLRTPEPPVAAASGVPIRTQVHDGVRAIWHHPVLRRSTAASAVRNFSNAAVGTVGLVYAYRVLHVSVLLAGTVYAAGTLAAVLGGALVGKLRRRLGVTRTLRLSNLAAACWALAPLAAVVPPLPLFFCMRTVSAFSLPLWNATIVTLRQHLTPNELLGRLTATAGTLNFTAIPLGALLGGAAGEAATAAYGPATGLNLVLAGAGLLVVGASILLGHPSFRTPESQPVRLPD